MFESQVSSQSQSKTAITLLVLGLFYCPAVFLLYRGGGYGFRTMIASVAIVFLGGAWMTWKKYLETVVPRRITLRR